jgi:hypothetical protein
MNKSRNMNPSGSSIYPLHPPGTRVIVKIPETELTFLDRVLVASSSLFIVGSVIWVPACLCWSIKRWRAIPKHETRRRTVYAAMIIAFYGIIFAGPQHSASIGKLLQVRKWRIWRAWIRFIAMEIISDQPSVPNSINNNMNKTLNLQTDKAIFAFVPHGIFPFPIALAVLPEIAQRAFGIFRPVVATATALFPIVRDMLMWVDKVDASRACVDQALDQGSRIGIVPGGIAEIFKGYPKPGTLPNEEYSIVGKGFLRLAIKHGVPVVPVYCFGATKMFKRLHLPLLENLSLVLRISLVVFFGACGLPIPFRQKLLYVMGQPIMPGSGGSGSDNDNTVSTTATTNGIIMDQQVDDMHARFCDELLRLFDHHKEAYGWSHKSLKLLSR